MKQTLGLIVHIIKYPRLKGIIWIALFISCSGQDGQKPFRTFSEDFAARYFQLFPDESPLRADNLRLNKIFIPTLENMDSASVFYQFYSRRLSEFSSVSLSLAEAKDYQKINNILIGVRTMTSERSSNPALFNIYRSLSRILRSSYAPLQVRIATISEKLSLAPAFYEAAKNQVTRTDRVKSGQAIRSHIETYLFLDQELRDSFILSATPDPVFLTKIEQAKLSVKDYIGFCESAKLN